MNDMKKSAFITLIVVCVVSLSITVAFAAKNNAISHPFSSDKYNENPTPIYTRNDTRDVKSFVSEGKCIESIAKTKTSHIKSKELKTWGQHVKDDEEEATNYQIDSNRMVRVIKTEFPDGLDTKAGFYKNAVLTSVFDAETGNLIESHITGDWQGQE